MPESNTSLGNIPPDMEKRLLELGRNIPSMEWWFSVHPKLGCSPRDAVDAGRLDEVELLTSKMAKVGKMFGVHVTLGVCPKCSKPAVDSRMHACLACDWQDPEHWK